MHILKLPWLGHRAENKQVECYSVSCNHDGTRLASGGLDGNVKLWDTASILKYKKGEKFDDDLERPLFSMSRHNGVVTSVKFSPDGRFLASGSDDKIVLIWEKDEEQTNRPKPFGELEPVLEHWTVRKRLVAHDNDIQDVCWSPDGSLLVSVGLDRLIIIWNGITFERIKRYDIHQSMVKGIVFDPANKFFATASDDRTVRVFRYHRKNQEYSNYEFQMEHIVMEPFKKSPLTSYFRRMSWSPDGQHIAVPNATNGPVTSVAVINRGSWATDISLIGHEAPCEVCSFSPRLFEVLKEGESKSNYSTVLATAGQDRTLAVWNTANSRPIVVTEELTGGSITDITWSSDGETLYLSCLDGSITCVAFDENELGVVVDESMNNSQLHRYGVDRESSVFPEGIEQLRLEQEFAGNESDGQVYRTPPRTVQAVEPVERERKVTPVSSPKPAPKISSKVTITKNGKKRVAPTLVSTSSASNSKISNFPKPLPAKFNIGSKLSQTSYNLQRIGIQTSVHGIKEKTTLDPSLNETYDPDNDNEDMGIDDSNNQGLSGAVLKRQRNRLKKAAMDLRYPHNLKPVSDLTESLFSNHSVLNSEISTILKGTKDYQIDLTNSSSVDVDEDLIFSVILNGVKHFENPHYADGTPREVRSSIEVRNGEPWPLEEDEFEHDDNIDFQDPTTVIVTNSLDSINRKHTLYFPYRIQHAYPFVVDGVLVYYVLISIGGTVQIILAESGNYLCPSIELGETILAIRQSKKYLMLLTCGGLIYTWELSVNMRHIKLVIKGVSIAAILNSIELPAIDKATKKVPTLQTPSLQMIDVNPSDGTPLVIVNGDNTLLRYSTELMCWTSVVDSWYFQVPNLKVKSKNDTVNRLIRQRIEAFKKDVQRNKISSYTFTQNNNELKQIMTTRYDELIDLI